MCFDAECRPLAYWYDGQTTSEITAFGWKWDGQPEAETLMLRPGGCFETDDGQLLDYVEAYQVFRETISSAALVYGHNIRRFDLPIIQGQLLRLKMEPLEPLLTSDTCRDYPRRKDMSVSLENLAALYNLEGDKKRMAQADWEQANRLDDDGVSAARERVVSDVLLQAQLRTRLLELGLLAAPRVWR